RAARAPGRGGPRSADEDGGHPGRAAGPRPGPATVERRGRRRSYRIPHRAVRPFSEIRYDVEDRVCTVTLNRPDRLNAVTSTTIGELGEAWERADADDRVRAVIVTGSGRAYCAGADLGPGGTRFNQRHPTPARAPAPRIGFVVARRGVVPEAASTWFRPRLVGISQAAEWVYTGRVFSADEALAGRLVSRVVAPEALLPTARQLAREIADNTSAVSVTLARQMMWKLLGADHPMEAHRLDSQAMFWTGRSDDAREGVTAFLE